MESLARLSDLIGRALNFAHLRFAADTADPATGALLQRGSERATAIQTQLVFFELEWVEIDDDRAEELLATEGLEFCAHHLRMERRYRPHLLSAPEEKIVSELSLTGRGAWNRLFDELTSAIRVDLPENDEPVAARRRALRPLRPGPRAPPHGRRGGHGRPRARPADPRLRLQHAAPGEGHDGPAPQVPALARHPQPLQRGIRRVGRRAGRSGQGPQRAGPPLVPDEGEAARHRAARRLRPDGRRRRRRGEDRMGGRQADRPRDLRLGLAADERDRRPLLRRELDRRAAAAVEARRRLQRLDRALGPSLRDAQLDRSPPRRDHPRPRARPRDPPVPGARAGHLPPEHAAHGRRDRLGLRRGARLRAPAERGRRPALPPQPARRVDRGSDRHRLPPDRDEPVRGPGPHRAPQRGRALGGALRRALGRVADRDARRLGRGDRGLQDLVVLRPPLHRHARLRLRVRLRPAAGALGLPPLPRPRRRDRSRLPRDARLRRLPLPRGARPDRRRRSRRPGLLGPWPRPRRRAARRWPRRPPKRSWPNREARCAASSASP